MKQPRRASGTTLSRENGFKDLVRNFLEHKQLIERALASSGKILAVPVLLAFNWTIAAPKHDNFWLNIFMVTNKRPDTSDGIPHYAKSYWVSGVSHAKR